MIITRTPYRVSFFGGGTDYPQWYREHGGSVLSTTIDKYCYITCRYLMPFFKHRHRIAHSQVELVKSSEEIKHPAAREVMRFLNADQWEFGLEIHHDGDLPARSGIGSSSSFTVGLLHAIHGIRGTMLSKKRLMLDAIHVEQNLIKKAVGSQDQAVTTHGGLCHITFERSGEISIRPVIVKKERRQEFCSHLMLFHTDFQRLASEVARGVIDNISKCTNQLHLMAQMVDEGLNLLVGNGDIGEFGKLLHESWRLKQELSDQVSNSHIDEMYQAARDAGALGGKPLGVGSGGFLLCFARPECQDAIREKLKGLLSVPFDFETKGSEVIFYKD